MEMGVVVCGMFWWNASKSALSNILNMEWNLCWNSSMGGNVEGREFFKRISPYWISVAG